jgi:hypothetical protein
MTNGGPVRATWRQARCAHGCAWPRPALTAELLLKSALPVIVISVRTHTQTVALCLNFSVVWAPRLQMPTQFTQVNGECRSSLRCGTNTLELIYDPDFTWAMIHIAAGSGGWLQHYTEQPRRIQSIHPSTQSIIATPDAAPRGPQQDPRSGLQSSSEWQPR